MGPVTHNERERLDLLTDILHGGAVGHLRLPAMLTDVHEHTYNLLHGRRRERVKVWLDRPSSVANVLFQLP